MKKTRENYKEWIRIVQINGSSTMYFAQERKQFLWFVWWEEILSYKTTFTELKNDISRYVQDKFPVQTIINF